MTDSLVSRLTALTGPSREIDAEIALANGWRHVFEPNYWRCPSGQIYSQPPRFTESIDTVLTLMPKCYLWSVARTSQRFIAEIIPATGSIERNTITMCSVSPAIALVIACLKAKEDSKP